MSELPAVHTPSVSGLAKRKFLGVPILYLAGGFVLILAVYAYKTKKSASALDTAAAAPVDTTTDAPVLTDGTVLPTLPSGSVTGTAPTTALPNTAISTNDEWIKAGVAFLVGRGTSGGLAQGVLQKYLDGAQLTYTEGVMRDTVIGQYGLPPTLLPTGGTADKPVVTPIPPVIPKAPPVHPPTKNAPHPSIPFPGQNVVEGNTGTVVRRIQVVVHAVNDGKYDYRTKAHVASWQGQHGLPATGTVDQRTWNRMFP